MNKQEFLATVREGLSCLSAAEAEERLGFLAEMIDDAMEEGLCEEDAVLRIGAPDKIIAGILFELVAEERIGEKSAEAESPAEIEEPVPVTPAPADSAPDRKRLSGGVITLIAVGSVVWVPLLIAAFAVGLSLYVSMWSVIASLWAAFGAFALAVPTGLAAGACIAFQGKIVSCVFFLGATLMFAGLAIFAFFGCLKLTELAVALTKKIFVWLRNLFKREERCK